MDDEVKVSQKGKPGTTFPYYDLEQSAQLGQLAHELGGSATLDQLAGKAQQTPGSGAFRLRLSAALQFGFLERDRDRYRLADTGVLLMQANRSAQARVTAFLRVPLYRRIFHEFKGRMMPPPQGIENFMRNAGVVPGQVDRARQAFQRSAEQAGLFQFGKDRLVLPPGTSEDGTGIAPEGRDLIEPTEVKDTSPSKTADVSLHPALQGMLQELPEKGESWTEAEFKAWSDAFLGVLRVVHKPTKEEAGQ